MKKRQTMIKLLAASLMFSMITGATTPTFAHDNSTVLEKTITDHVVINKGISNQEAFAGYVEKELFGAQEMQTFGLREELKLTGATKQAYDGLKKGVQNIANGKNPDGTEVVDGKIFANIEVPITGEAYYDHATNSIKGLDYFAAIDMLMYNCPYELYWHNKVIGTQIGFNFDLSHHVTKIHFTMAVVDDFNTSDQTNWGDETEPNYVKCHVDHSKLDLTNKTKNKAQQIVDKYANLDDEAKLTAYKDEICKLTDYNYETADIMYGNPWQVLYVFDEDPNTNVVCEGYSKAFQLLCDMSTFQNAECRTVSGILDETGAHMWNIVRLNDSNYLADITNSDRMTVGFDGSLFLKQAKEGNIQNGYNFKLGSGSSTISFAYDKETQEIYGESVLNMIGSTVMPPMPEPAPDPKPWPKPDYPLTPIEPATKGDVNMDAVVNIYDYRMVSDYIYNNKDTDDYYFKKAADMDGNGLINIHDLKEMGNAIFNM